MQAVATSKDGLETNVRLEGRMWLYIFSFFAGGEFLGFSSSDPVTVVLEDDGTIVEDEAYFLCLPLNTKFMLLHEKETWSPIRRSKEGGGEGLPSNPD